MLTLIDFLRRLFSKKKVHPESTTSDEIVTKPKLSVIFKWKGRSNDTYHWWPMRETKLGEEDICNNLYATGGGLSKYGTLFCAKTIEYQKAHHFRDHNSTKSDANWAGFCDSAAMLSCLWEYPKYKVIVTYNDKTEIFTPEDIEALMIVASDSTIRRGKSVFYGERYDGLFLEDKGEPYPTDLLSMLKKVCRDDYPFVLDVEHREAVWNYSYNDVIVNISNTLPPQFQNKVREVPSSGLTVYYNFIIKSDAYQKKNLDFWGWCNENGGTFTEGWLSHKHPDFVWKKYPSKAPWVGMCRINPEINARHVYDIYKKSLEGGHLSY